MLKGGPVAEGARLTRMQSPRLLTPRRQAQPDTPVFHPFFFPSHHFRYAPFKSSLPRSGTAPHVPALVPFRISAYALASATQLRSEVDDSVAAPGPDLAGNVPGRPLMRGLSIAGCTHHNGRPGGCGSSPQRPAAGSSAGAGGEAP